MESARGKGKEGARFARQRIDATGPLQGHLRYHRAQATLTRDTSAKKAARRAGLDFITCPCGSRFASAVTGLAERDTSARRNAVLPAGAGDTQP